MKPLTDEQETAVAALVRSGRLGVVPADLARATEFMRQAEDVMADLPNLTRPQNRYNLAYDACHDVGEAILAAHGYRTLAGPGQHDAIGRFLRIVLDQPPGNREARRFDVLRRSRNQQRYAARPVSETDAALAEQTAVGLHAAARDRGLTEPSPGEDHSDVGPA